MNINDVKKIHDTFAPMLKTDVSSWSTDRATVLILTEILSLLRSIELNTRHIQENTQRLM